MRTLRNCAPNRRSDDLEAVLDSFSSLKYVADAQLVPFVLSDETASGASRSASHCWSTLLFAPPRHRTESRCKTVQRTSTFLLLSDPSRRLWACGMAWDWPCITNCCTETTKRIFTTHSFTTKEPAGTSFVWDDQTLEMSHKVSVNRSKQCSITGKHEKLPRSSSTKHFCISSKGIEMRFCTCSSEVPFASSLWTF